MGLDLLRKLAPQLASLGTNNIGLHGIGETLLHPDLREGIEILRVHNPKTYMGVSTNGTFLTRKNFDKIEGLVDEISVCIDGFDRETYEKHRVGGNLDKIISNVLDIMECRRELKSKTPRFWLQMIDLGQGEKEKMKFKEFWESKILPQDKVRFSVLGSFGGQIPGVDKRMQKCSALYSMVSILWDGRLSTCCCDSDAMNVMGDVNVEEIKTIFYNAAYQDMRKKHENGTLQQEKHLLCHTCLAS